MAKMVKKVNYKKLVYNSGGVDVGDRGCDVCGKKNDDIKWQTAIDWTDHSNPKIFQCLCFECYGMLMEADYNAELLRKAADYAERINDLIQYDS